MALTFRPIERGQIDAFRDVMGKTFGFDPHPDDQERLAGVLEWDRTVGTYDGEMLVATGGVFSQELTIPGGTARSGGITVVAVMPTHRRRGALTGMMRRMIDDCRDRGEPLSGLWASESLIYGRYGFGIATHLNEVEVETDRSAFLDAVEWTGTVRMIDNEEAEKILPAVYERLRPSRPGLLARNEPWWKHERFYDPERWREGRTALRFALYEEDGTALGYVEWRGKEKWERHPQNEAHIRELQAVTPQADAALWRFMLDLDLVKTVRYWNAPLDTAVAWMMREPRRMTQHLGDALWLRLVDVPAALAARAYSTGGRLVLQVADEFCPWNEGRFELRADADGRARCEPTADDPDLTLTACELGAAYLGGVALSTLARAGRVQGSADALRRGDAMFSWQPAPWCPEVF